MAIISGQRVNYFKDRKIKVRVLLNTIDKGTESINKNKFQPFMLEKAKKMVEPVENIGQACIVPRGAPLDIRVTSSGGICGIKPVLRTTHEIIFNDVYTSTTKEYEEVTSSIRRYSERPRLIQVTDWRGFDREF